MRCSSILVTLVMGLTVSVGHAQTTGVNEKDNTGTEWRKLNSVNEPPNQPSKQAAKVATQHLTQAQIQVRLKRMTTLYRASSAHANGTALQILKREIQLLQLAGAE